MNPARGIRVESIEVGGLLKVQDLQIVAPPLGLLVPQGRDGTNEGRDLVIVHLRLQQVVVFEALRQAEPAGAEEVEDDAENVPVPVDEVVALLVKVGRHELAVEHGADHGVRVLGQGGARGGVEDAADIQRDHLVGHPHVHKGGQR